MEVPREEFLEEIERYSDPNVPLRQLEVEDRGYLKRLTRRIRDEGIKEPLIILVRKDGTRVLWDGHHRLIALKRLGVKRVPVRYIGESLETRKTERERREWLNG